MAVLHSEVQVAGHRAPCTNTQHSLLQRLAHTGQPTTDVLAGLVKLTFTGEEALADIWCELGADSYRHESGHVGFFHQEGHTFRRLTFYDAYCVLYRLRFDARGQDGQSSLEADVYFAPATIDLDGIRIENYSKLWWEKDRQVRFNALNKPPELLPSSSLRASPAATRLEQGLSTEADFIRFDKKKKVLSERPQSKKTGFLGSPKLTKPQLSALAKVAQERYGVSVQVVKADEMALITGKSDVRAMLRTELDITTGQRTGTIYVQKGATAYEITHELMHVKQFHQSGYKAYWVEQTQLQREEFVFNELMKSKTRWSEAEIKHAANYIKYVKHGQWPNG